MTTPQTTNNPPKYHTNNGQGYQVTRPTPITTTDGQAQLASGVTTVQKRVMYQPRLMEEERKEIIVAFIRGQVNIDELRLRLKKSRRHAYRIVRAFKESDDYGRLLDDEWDRMTFDKRFDESIGAIERYRAITQLKKARMQMLGSRDMSRKALDESEAEVTKVLRDYDAVLRRIEVKAP